MKRIVSLCIALMLVLSLFPMSVTAAEDCVYLSDLEFSYGNMVSANWPGVDKIKTTGKPLTIAGQSFSKGIAIHPTATAAAYCVWDISSYSYNAFKAVIGKDDVNKDGAVSIEQQNAYNKSKSTYSVYCDGKLIFTKTLVANTMQEIGISIPKGTKEIKLEAGNGGDGHSYDGSDFAMARLCNDLLPDNGTFKPDCTQDYVYLSDMNYSDYNAFVGQNGAYIARDKNIRGTSLYTKYNSYDKGLCLHAAAKGSAKVFVEFDIEGLGYNIFTTYLGLAESKTDTLTDASVNFIVYLDGDKAYESGEMTKADEDKLISIDITGASKLKLVVDPGASNSSDWGTFGNAVIGRYPYIFENVSVSVGNDMNVSVTTDSSYFAKYGDNLSVIFTVDGAEKEPVSANEDGEFILSGLYLSDMNANIDIFLLNNGVIVDAVTDWSVNKYLTVDLAESEAAELAANVSRLGSEIDKYFDGDGWEVSDDASEIGKKADYTPTAAVVLNGEADKFTSAQLYIDDNFNLRFNFAAENATKIVIDGSVEITDTDLLKGYVMTDDISVTELTKQFTVEMYNGEELLASVTYSAANYIYNKFDATESAQNGIIRALAAFLPVVK